MISGKKRVAAEPAASVLEAYDECNKFFSPHIKKLLRIFAVIPVTTSFFIFKTNLDLPKEQN